MTTGIGNQILRIVSCTISASRGKYARLSVLVIKINPLLAEIYIGKQHIAYDGFNNVYLSCGRLNHKTIFRPYNQTKIQ